MQPAAEKPPTFWARWFCQKVDPKAGTFRHEVIFRMGLGLLAVLSGALTDHYVDPEAVRDVLFYLVFFAPEVFLRRDWKLGLYIPPLCVPLVYLQHQDDPVLLATASGAWYGLLAGVGSRSLLACVLGLALGSLAGWLGTEAIAKTLQYGIQPLNGPLDFVLFDAEGIFIASMPIYFGAGLSVWLGMKWGKRKSATDWAGNGGGW